MSRVKTYSKYVVERSVGGRSVVKNEDGTPKLGKLMRNNIRITPEIAATLNDGWDSIEKPIAFYYVVDEDASIKANEKAKTKKSKSKKNIDKLKEANEELLLADIENKKLKLKEENEALKVPKKTKKELVAECENLGIETSGNVKELNERIANHKAE